MLLPQPWRSFSFLPSLNEVKSVTCQTHVRHKASIIQNVLASQKTRIFDIIDIINSHTAVADLAVFLLDQPFYLQTLHIHVCLHNITAYHLYNCCLKGNNTTPTALLTTMKYDGQQTRDGGPHHVTGHHTYSPPGGVIDASLPWC